MNILMINPRGMYFDEGVAAYKRISQPMGLMQLSSAVKKIKFDEGGKGWASQETDIENRNVKLIDAAAEGFGSDDGEGDPLVERDGKRIRLFGLDDEAILNQAREFAPDVVFITAQFTKQLDEFYAISNLIKENFPNTLVVGGGIALTQLDQMPIDPTLDSEERVLSRKNAIKQPFKNGVDLIVKSEGELTAVKLIDQFENIKNNLASENKEFNLSEVDLNQFLDVPNLAIKPENEEDRPENTSEASISEEEYNRLPFPDLAAIQKEIYHKKRAHFGEAKSDNWIELFTSRGCSKSCTFCSTQPYFKTYRKLTSERVKALLEYYKEYGYDEVSVEDDSILDYPARAAELFQMIKDTGFKQFTSIGGIEFKHLLFDSHGGEFYMKKAPAADEKWFLTKEEYLNEIKEMSPQQAEHAYAKLVDGKELIKAMSSDIDPETGLSKENGCYRIYLATESGNKETLEAIGKDREYPVGPNGEVYSRLPEEAIQLLAENGIEAHGGMMMGNPQTEGIPEIMNNIRFSRKLMENGLGRIAFFPYIMLPGSHMSKDTNFPNKFKSESGETYEPYARIRKEHGYLSYGFDTTNMDSLKHGWTAEELTTINIWANNLFSAGSGKNWEAGKAVTEEELERQIEFMSDPEILYQATALRLMKEGGQQMLQYYHEAIQAIQEFQTTEADEAFQTMETIKTIGTEEALQSKEAIEAAKKIGAIRKFPEYAYELKENEELTDQSRQEMLDESIKIIENLVKDDPNVEINHDHRSSYAKDFTELVMRAPEIKVLPTDETLINQESSDYLEMETDTEITREIKQEVQSEDQIPNPGGPRVC